MEKLKGKVAYITGGNKGIGLGIAQSLLTEGIKVAISGRNPDDNAQAFEKLGGDSENAITLESDVRKEDQEKANIAEILKKWGHLDIVIANAGVGHFGSIENLTSQQWNEVIDINLTGVFNTVKASIPPLKDSQGYVMTIASLAGTNFFAGGAAYNASKFGLVGFSQAIMLDLRYSGIKVTTIMPGSVATYFNDRIPGPGDNWKIQPEDIGQIVVDLLKINPRTLPSKVEVRPSQPPKK